MLPRIVATTMCADQGPKKIFDAHPDISPRTVIKQQVVHERVHRGVEVLIRRPLSLDRLSGVWGQLNPLPCSPFPEPKFRPVCAPPQLTRSTSPSLFWASKRYPHSKPFQNRFGTDFEAILVPKMVQKSIKNRSKIDVCMRLRFLIDFL